jgi:ankyrin repeat protein
MKRIEEALEILTENVQQTSYLSWLTIKKGVLAHNISSVAENQNLIQEFTTLMRYVAHQLPKLQGVEITMDQAAQVVSSHVIGFDFMINPELPLYGHLLNYTAVNGSGLNKSVIDTLVTSCSSAGLSINVPDERGQTPLMLSLESKNINLFFTLVEYGVDVEALDSSGYTVLHKIMEYIRIGEMDINILDKWIEAGYKTNIKDKHGFTVIDHLKHHSDEPIAQQMLTCLGELHDVYESKDEIISLQDAVESGDDDLVMKIISDGTGSIKPDEKGNSVLHYAANSNRVDLVEKLAKHGSVDFNMEATEGALPITQALVSANLELAKAFVAGGANINYQAEDGNTLLHALCEAGMIDSIKVAISCGGRADILSLKGKTPLHEFLENGSALSSQDILEIIALLCNSGASKFLDHKDDSGNDIMSLVANFDEEISEMINAIHLSTLLENVHYEVDSHDSVENSVVIVGNSLDGQDDSSS